MLSILFIILTIDDMQDDASAMLWFLLKYWEKIKIVQKNLFFCEFFCLCPLTLCELHPKILPSERPY